MCLVSGVCRGVWCLLKDPSLPQMRRAHMPSNESCGLERKKNRKPLTFSLSRRFKVTALCGHHPLPLLCPFNLRLGREQGRRATRALREPVTRHQVCEIHVNPFQISVARPKAGRRIV